MRRFLYLLILFCLGCLATARTAYAEEIKPPFGLEWGETEARVGLRLAGAKAKVTEKRVVKDRDMWVVEGLVQTNLSRTVFYFRNSGLVEVELQYQNAAWTDADYNSFFTQLRQKVDARYGIGKLISRSKTPDGELVQTVVGYEWTKGNTAIHVIYFGAEKGTQAYRTVSLHYISME